MHQYLTELAEKKEPGLYLLASPTSSGKSYHSSRVLFEKAKERKSIYVTTLTKNLTDMERDLKNLYGTEEEYRKNVVRLYSIEDNLKRLYKKHIRLSKGMEKDEKILKAYRELINACDNYFFRQDLADSKKQTEREEMLLAEHKFRNVIRAYYIKLNALTSKRSYKKAFTPERAIDMILNGDCGMLNPVLLNCLEACQNQLVCIG